MARIRTIKPEFFTSDDICALSPLARLLYIGLWCEADREGRLVWQPRGFKRRYLPDDDCDIDRLCEEILTRNMVRLYADGLAFIPTFSTHQHVNPREAQSKLPPPPENHASARVTDASSRDSDRQGGRELKEGEGRERSERVGDAPASAPRPTMANYLPDDWLPTVDDHAWADKARPDLKGVLRDQETERFRNHAKANNRTAFDWSPNWRNWISRAKAAEPEKSASRKPWEKDEQTLPPEPRLPGRDGLWRLWMTRYKPGDPWDEVKRGPRPESADDNPKLDDEGRKEWRRQNGLPADWRKVSA